MSFSIMIPWAVLSNDEDAPSRQDIGYIILMTFPTYLMSALGTWLAVRKVSSGNKRIIATGIPNRVPEPDSSATSETTKPPQLEKRLYWRRPIQIAVSFALLVGLSWVIAWRVRTHSQATVCPNPPTTAMLNFWPVGYSQPLEMCHDYSAVDARLVATDHYSRSREEWEQGLIVHSGDEFYVLIYINNGATDNAEEVNPGRGIARNVRLTTEVGLDASAVQYVKVVFGGENTNTVVSRFKINSAAQDKLQVQPNSGEIYNFNATELIAKDLNVGNSTIVVGNVAPDASVFVRFRVKVLDNVKSAE